MLWLFNTQDCIWEFDFFQQIFLDGISPGPHEVYGINSPYLQQNKEIDMSCKYDYIMVHIALFHSIH